MSTSTTTNNSNPLNTALIVDINSKEFQNAQLVGSKIANFNHVTIGIKQTIDGSNVKVLNWCFIGKGKSYRVQKDHTNGLTGLKIYLSGDELISFKNLEARLGATVITALKASGINNAVMEPSITEKDGVSSLKLKFKFESTKAENDTLFRDETCPKDTYLKADDTLEYKDLREIDHRHPLVLRISNYEQFGKVNLLIQPNGANMVPAANGPIKVYLSWNIKMLNFDGSKYQPESVDLKQFNYNEHFVVPAETFDASKVMAMESNSKTGAQLESCLYNFGYNPLASSKKLLLKLPLQLSTMGIEKVQPYNPTQGKAPAKKAVKSKAPEPKNADKYVMNISFPLNEANKEAYENILGLQKWLDTYMADNFSVKTKGGEVSTEPNPKHPELYKTQVPFMREPKLSKKGDATYVSLKLSVPTYDFPIFDDTGKTIDRSEFVNNGTPGSMKPLPFRVNIIVSPLIWMTKAMGYGMKLYVSRIDKVTKKSNEPVVHNNYSASLLDDDDMPTPSGKSEVIDVVIPDNLVLDDDDEEIEEEDDDDEDDE